LTVGDIGYEESHNTASDDIERVMAGIHDTAHGNKTRGKKRSEYEHGFPYFTTGIEDMKLSSKEKRKISKTSKRNYCLLGK